MQKNKRYRKPEAVQELEKIANEAARLKYPGMDPKYIAARKYRDDSANALTKCVIDYIKFQGGSAYRINSQGQYDSRLKKWRFSGQRRGLPDVHGSINGRSVYVEIKIGRNTLSPDQKKIRAEIEGSGGLFFVAQDFTSFKQWFDDIIPG